MRVVCVEPLWLRGPSSGLRWWGIINGCWLCLVELGPGKMSWGDVALLGVGEGC